MDEDEVADLGILDQRQGDGPAHTAEGHGGSVGRRIEREDLGGNGKTHRR